MNHEQEFNELHDAMVECGIWSDTGLSQDEHGWGYTDEYGFRASIYEHHALHIARGIAEEWLIEHGMDIMGQGTYDSGDLTSLFRSLPDAIRYAMKQERNEG